ncbi:hypothetical protein KC365_g15984 [Hortaea werneckii]|nr:hypothetical protein KC323_g9150 [Hortaea werneckii]KAI7208659.1 hypothetical protein KC365_g15984 [Hortaea werneckii]
MNETKRQALSGAIETWEKATKGLTEEMSAKSLIKLAKNYNDAFRTGDRQAVGELRPRLFALLETHSKATKVHTIGILEVGGIVKIDTNCPTLRSKESKTVDDSMPLAVQQCFEANEDTLDWIQNTPHNSAEYREPETRPGHRHHPMSEKGA